MYSDFKITRRKSKQLNMGGLLVGGNAPISVQSMTNTQTVDVKSTLTQINLLADAGADTVRVSCPCKDSTKALQEIVKKSPVPIIADIHFNYQRAIEAAKAGAACLRFNPGNIGSKERVKELIKAAKDNNAIMRIGVNAGSLEKHLLEKHKGPTSNAMVESALNHTKILEDNDFFDFKISVKSSDFFVAVDAYRKLAKACNYPLHIGITEAGPLRAGTVLSSAGLAMLLSEGIGDTLRVSLSADPVEEVKVGFEILKALKLRNRGVKIISCPSCARQGFDVVKTVALIEEGLEFIKEPLVISILGCIVNGVGEAKHSHIGIVGINNNYNQVYVNGEKTEKLTNENLVQGIIEIASNYVKNNNLTKE